MEKRPFSDATYAAKLGTYKATQPAEYPANEVFIGRERERAAFLNLLLNLGRRGAFLITGNRGSGKTTFVRHCLDEYQHNVYRRFQASDVGRSFFWDRALLLFFGSLVACSAMVGSELLAILLPGHDLRPEHFSNLIACGILTLVLSWTLIAAYEFLVVAVERQPWSANKVPEWWGDQPVSRLWLRKQLIRVATRGQWGPYTLRCGLSLETPGSEADRSEAARPEAKNRLTAFVYCLGLLILAWSEPVFTKFDAAGIVVGELVLLIGSCALFVALFGYSSRTRKVDLSAPLLGDDISFDLSSPEPSRRWVPMLALLLFACLYVWLWPNPESPSAVVYFSVVNVCLAALVVGGAWLRRGLDVRSISKVEFLVNMAVTQRSLVSAQRRYLYTGAFLIVSSLVGGHLAVQGSIRLWIAWWVGVDAFALLMLGGELWRWFDLQRLSLQSGRNVRFGHQLQRLPFMKRCLNPLALKAGRGEWIELPFRLHPRPRPLLFLKAFALVTVGVQLLFPVLYRCGLYPHSPPALLFHNNSDELVWVFGIVALFLVIVALESEWTLRPLAQLHDEAVIHERASEGGTDNHNLPSGFRFYNRRLLEQTLVWRLLSAWLPVLTVRVNLGFDNLHYRRVIEAMVLGLRQEFRGFFLKWRSPYTAVRRVLCYGSCAVLALVLGDLWLGLELGNRGANLCSSPANAGLRLICEWESGGEAVARALYWSPLGPAESKSGVLRSSLGLRSQSSAQTGRTAAEIQGSRLALIDVLHTGRQSLVDRVIRIGRLRQSPLHFHLYHFLLFLGFVWLGRRFLAWLDIFPYRQLDRRMSKLLEGLSHRVSHEDRPEGFRLSDIVPFWRQPETLEKREGGPFDPRTIELTFLEILSDLQDPSTQILMPAFHRASPPVPEVVFVFDELDKIGLAPTHLEPEGVPTGENGEQRGTTRHPPTDLTDRRSRELHRLLADFKNLLSSGDARFVFIGGRNLHDEWLADQSARYPLLTHIFESEIYLPSLLTDASPGTTVTEGIRLYLASVRQRAEALNRMARRRTMIPWPALELERRRRSSFVEPGGPSSSGLGSSPPSEDLFLIVRVNSAAENGPCFSAEILREPARRRSPRFDDEFVSFLAYRSLGSLKRAQELLEGFIRSTDRAVESPFVRACFFDCDQVLRFKDRDIFRIQLTYDIFHKLRPLLSARVEMGDDKLATGLLYLADYILKFHRRAFSMADMERVDELVDIHRAPDLRHVLKQLVLSWSDTYLHRIRNGMYDYRFQSEFAREIEYVSRISERELAAFNFTLDESKALKAAYRARLAEKPEAEDFELVAALGELHEFDEEFETARHHYRRAISLLDQGFEDNASKSAAFAALYRTPEAREALRNQASWAVARVRLTLQIGLTFERVSDLEQAQVEYRNARSLASAVIEAMMEGGSDSTFSFTLKHLNILFEPAFAEAWLSEKVASGVDTGPALLEGELWQLRASLPFVKPADFVQDLVAESPSTIKHSNFALLLANLHDKAGDLYFFKGRQLVGPDLAKDWRAETRGLANRAQGLLLQAQYHYAVGLHDLRRFNLYRRISSGIKFNSFEGNEHPTIEPGEWAEFPLRLASATLLDFAETLLARVSLAGFLARAEETPSWPASEFSLHKAREGATSRTQQWLDSTQNRKEEASSWTVVLQKLFPHGLFNPSTLDEWLCPPTKGLPEILETQRLISNAGGHPDDDRCATAIALALGASQLQARGGYPKSRSSEYLRIAATATQLLWWRKQVQFLKARNPKAGSAEAAWGEAFVRPSRRVPGLCLDLAVLAEACLSAAVSASKAPGKVEDTPSPRSSAVYAAGLGLALLAQKGKVSAGPACTERPVIGRLKALLELWFPRDPKQDDRTYFRSCLELYLERNSFPVFNRLMGLKMLVDDDLLYPGGLDVTGAYLGELLHLERQYASVLHFTPFQLGSTLSLAALSGRAWGKSDLTRKELCRGARQSLLASQEMITMRRKYYEVISDLYYLFDDFNDRMIHYNHAIQMMAVELTSYLLAALDEPDKRP